MDGDGPAGLQIMVRLRRNAIKYLSNNMNFTNEEDDMRTEYKMPLSDYKYDLLPDEYGENYTGPPPDLSKPLVHDLYTEYQ